mmetsp:Transcript_79515/g.215045  ORF Transcript_79515/g.215045 Transcript_79515/m.215045 type:complete len:96 (-) Transcript_79515:30-317(-)
MLVLDMLPRNRLLDPVATANKRAQTATAPAETRRWPRSLLRVAEVDAEALCLSTHVACGCLPDASGLGSGANRQPDVQARGANASRDMALKSWFS